MGLDTTASWGASAGASPMPAAPAPAIAAEPAICEAGGVGLIFPLGGSWELAIPRGVRGLLYGIALVYFFFGISIVADTFMASIEKVTSQRIRRRTSGDKGAGFRTHKVWNETIATLTLMALGSSAPEIILAIIDVFKKGFHFGTIGPSCIVGSASFNLLVITAVCIFVIPSDEVRVIQNIPAFYITAFFSMIAYVWMAFIVLVISKEVVELWEALVTFFLLPVLLYICWKVDNGGADGCLRRLGIKEEEEEEQGEGAGRLAFPVQCLRVGGSEESQTVEVAVLRRSALELPGPVKCRFHTEPMSAVPGFDYEPLEGELEFAEGEMERSLQLQLPGTSSRSWDAAFLVVLDGAEGGATIDPESDGGEGEALLTVTVEAHGPGAGALLRTMEAVVRVDALQLAAREWVEQLRSVPYCNGSAEEQREASLSDWAMHLISLPWTLIVSLMPPLSLACGWWSFAYALFVIAVQTACVSDLAELFGCVLNIPDLITAITFVAMGTSMPDLFASITAAKADATADASIVNVTGSNSVNVFLGLGIPWTIAALHWLIHGRDAEWEAMYPAVAARITGAAFVVEASDLGFSLVAFLWVCILGLLLLHLRRKWLKAELGGPFASKVVTSAVMLLLWAGWVVVVSGQVLLSREPWEIHGTALALSLIAMAVAIVVMRRDKRTLEQQASLVGTSPDGAAEQSVVVGKAMSETCAVNAEDCLSCGNVGVDDKESNNPIEACSQMATQRRASREDRRLLSSWRTPKDGTRSGRTSCFMSLCSGRLRWHGVI